VGEKDFGHSGNDFFQGTRQFDDYGVSIAYYRCSACGFTFTNAFDSWSRADFRSYVYNEDYCRADPPFETERPQRNAALLSGLWHSAKGQAVVLDYGGGNGALARHLSALGLECHSCDVFYGDAFTTQQRYSIISCFEVIEHVPHRDQGAWFQHLIKRLAPGGTLLLSTELLSATADVHHRYISPRNGHISVHSRQSLGTLAQRFGLTVFSVNAEMHFLRDTASV
jgi:2-polyprenyl-6-hydroxyphenyl methylase/3-demethylubiquinone-9 3-methyltransferase